MAALTTTDKKYDFSQSFYNDLHRENRKRLLEELQIKSGVVYIEGAKHANRFDTDVEILCRQESNFFYLSGVNVYDHALALNASDGTCTLFTPKLPPSHALWLGSIDSKDTIRERYGVDAVEYTEDAPAYLSKFDSIYTLDKQSLPSGVSPTTLNEKSVRRALIQVRMVKSDVEVQLMRAAAEISSQAHTQLMKIVKPGMNEVQLDSEFTKFVKDRGCPELAYPSITASGKNGSILHYMDNNAPVLDNDLLLIDAGGEFHCYASDITRCFPASGKFSEAQKEIYNIVLHCQKEVIKALKPGVSYVDLHTQALRLIGEGLVKYDFIRGDLDELMENNIPAVFLPHGLGHFIGMDVHDVGGYGEDEKPRDLPSYRYLRLNRVLKAGHVITIEPGCYFVQPALQPALADEKLVKYFNVEKCQKFMNFGGVRIEDDILITKDGCDILSNAPKEIADIEAIMA